MSSLACSLPFLRLVPAARSVLLAALLASLSACAHTPRTDSAPPGPGDPFFRAPSPRGSDTIFTELDLPTPNRIRTAAGLPGPDYWQQRADYVIDATLDADRERVTATQRVRYTNHSPEPLTFLWIHMEQNLFREGSRGAITFGEGGRFGNRDAVNGGYENLHARIRGTQTPLILYDTIARLDLPEPLSPGSTVEFEIDFAFNIPPYGSDRMGINPVQQGKIFQLAQWFPAVAVYDDVYAWNALPYLGQGEFYTNFGTYEVSLTVPRSHIVAASGALMNPEQVLTAEQRDRLAHARKSRETVVIRSAEEVGQSSSRPPGDGPLTWKFRGENIRTFAWTSSDAYIWDAAAVDGDADASGTLAQSVYPREALPLWSESTDMLRFSIEHYNQKWLKYAYPVATNSNGVVGGMEYPMLIYCSERHDQRGLFGVTTHEIGHNWFPMMISNDERRHAWMDEGFNTFINYYANAARYGESALEGRRGDARAYVPDMLIPDQQPMEMPADQVTRLGSMQYAKPAAALVLLREYVLGEERFDKAFREYMHAWAFRAPRPWDFFRCMENASGENLDWFWRGFFTETGTLDQAVAGVDLADPNRPVITIENRAELVMPVEAKIEFTDNSTHTVRAPVEVWFHSNRWRMPVEANGRTIRSVTLDPREMLPDADPANNTWNAPKKSN